MKLTTGIVAMAMMVGGAAVAQNPDAIDNARKTCEVAAATAGGQADSPPLRLAGKAGGASGREDGREIGFYSLGHQQTAARERGPGRERYSDRNQLQPGGYAAGE